MALENNSINHNPESGIRNPELPFSAISPGRLDVMGGIADYSGSLLLQMPILETTRVKLTRREGRIFSVDTDTDELHQHFEIHIDELLGLDYSTAGILIRSKLAGNWAVYIIGCYLVLAHEKGLVFGGDDLFISSNIPTGKGVSSSAAVELATMHAILKAYEMYIEPLELAVLAQKVENLVVGAACGLMDQLSVSLGRKDHLLPIVCQPHQVMEAIKIPEGIKFFGIDSGVRHAVSGTSYGDVRTAAFMAFSIILKKMGTSKRVIEEARGSGQWSHLPYKGYLGNISLEEFNKEYSALIPETIKGLEFINSFGNSIDKVTDIVPDKVYSLRSAAAHPVKENDRIQRFRSLLKKFQDSNQQKADLIEMGALMYGSHEGYSSVGLGEPVTEMIVDKLKEKGISEGIFGARISGGGSGGTVVVMTDAEKGVESVKAIYQYMLKQTGMALYFFSGSSDGAHYVNTLF